MCDVLRLYQSEYCLIYIMNCFPNAVVNFRIIYPVTISEDIGSVDVCIEHMNGELSDEVQVTLQTSQIGSTATGINMCLHGEVDACHNNYTYRNKTCYPL